MQSWEKYSNLHHSLVAAAAQRISSRVEFAWRAESLHKRPAPADGRKIQFV